MTKASNQRGDLCKPCPERGLLDKYSVLTVNSWLGEDHAVCPLGFKENLLESYEVSIPALYVENAYVEAYGPDHAAEIAMVDYVPEDYWKTHEFVQATVKNIDTGRSYILDVFSEPERTYTTELVDEIEPGSNRHKEGEANAD